MEWLPNKIEFAPQNNRTSKRTFDAVVDLFNIMIIRSLVTHSIQAIVVDTGVGIFIMDLARS